MEDYIYIVIAIVVALILSIILIGLRLLLSEFVILNDRRTLDTLLAWSIMVFGLVLSFSLINFYNRYIELKNSLVEDATNLEVIYDMLKFSENSEDAINSMEKYLKQIKTDRLNRSKVKSLYDEMNNEILKYVKNNPNAYSNQILNRLSTDSQNINFTTEIDVNKFIINVILILFSFIFIVLFLVKLRDPIMQFISYFCYLSIICVIITLIILFGNPSLGKTIGLNFQYFIDLHDKIINDKKFKNKVA